MLQSLSPQWRRVLSSLAYSALVAVVAGLGYLTFQAINERRHGTEAGTEVAAEPADVALIDFNGFSARRSKGADVERLSVSLRLRLNAPGNLDCYVYFMARNDQVSPKVWAVWPTQGPGGAVTSGGHFRGTSPTTGAPVTLTASWTRITASFDQPPDRPAFNTILVFVVSPKGEILLSRPFAM